MNLTPASARMGCALNLERLRTELCSNHKAALTGQKERERRRVSFQSLRAVILYTTGRHTSLTALELSQPSVEYWITARRLWNDTHLCSRSFCPVCVAFCFKHVPDSKRYPCERWQGAQFIGVLT